MYFEKYTLKNSKNCILPITLQQLDEFPIDILKSAQTVCYDLLQQTQHKCGWYSITWK